MRPGGWKDLIIMAFLLFEPRLEPRHLGFSLKRGYALPVAEAENMVSGPLSRYGALSSPGKWSRPSYLTSLGTQFLHP